MFKCFVIGYCIGQKHQQSCIGDLGGDHRGYGEKVDLPKVKLISCVVRIYWKLDPGHEVCILHRVSLGPNSICKTLMYL